MRHRLGRALLVPLILMAAFIGILLAELTDNQASKQVTTWFIIGEVLVLCSGIAFLIWYSYARLSPTAEPEPGAAMERFGMALENEAAARAFLVLDPAGGDFPINLRFDKVTSPFRDYGGGASGDLVSIAEYFKSLSPERLVVLGGPGSGKTVLAVELQAQLLRSCRQNRDGPFPVLVSAVAYDPGQTWAGWLARHLAQRYQLPERTAARLVADGRILPIIDGVDELERTAAAALMTELNVFIRERESGGGGGGDGDGDGGRPAMVITCRDAQYRGLAEPLDEATHVEVRSLTTGDVRNYLRERGIEIPDVLAAVLSNPLMLSLADTIYGSGPDSAQSIDDLLSLPDETAMERHLLAAFLTSAYRPDRGGRSWPLAQASTG